MRASLCLALLAAACASDPKNGDGTVDGGADGADGADAADGADGSDGTEPQRSVSGTVTCGACTGEIVVAVFPEGDFDPETLFGAPVVDLRLDGPGEFEVPLAEPGAYWVMAWGEEEPNGGPDPFEPVGVTEAVIEVADGPVTGVDLALSVPISYGNQPDCDAHALDTVVQAAPLGGPPQTLTLDGLLDEWADIGAVALDPHADSETCGVGGSGATDLLSLRLTQDEYRTGFFLELADAPAPGVSYHVALRQLDPGGAGPWGAGDLELAIEHVGDGWQGAVVLHPTTTPEVVHAFAVGAGEDGLEAELEWGWTGPLQGYRARAFTGPDEDGDETAFVALGRRGLADAGGGVVPLSGGTLVFPAATAEGSVTAVLSGWPEVSLRDYDAALGVADVAFDVVLDGTWETAVAVSARLAEIVDGLEAEAAVEGFVPHAGRYEAAQMLSNGDLTAWTGHETDIVGWAMHTIQAEHAQQLFVDCYPRVGGSVDDVGVLVVDGGMNDAEEAGRTRFDTDEFFYGEVTLGDSRLEDQWEEEALVGTNWPHGFGVATLIGKRSTSAYEGRGEPSVIQGTNTYAADRTSGILAFGGIDGSFEPGNQAFEFPLRLGLWSADWAGEVSAGWIESAREGLASGDWDVMNASWGELTQGRYCVADNCEWNFGANGGCVCEGLPAPAAMCGGTQRWGTTAAQTRAFGQAARRLFSANEDTLFVLASGNDCLDLDESGGVSAWAEIDGTEDNVLMVAGVEPGADPDDVTSSRGSNYGSHAVLAAPYTSLTWKPGMFYTKEADTDVHLTRIVWNHHRGMDLTYRWASGTSYSAPMVSAVAGLAKAVLPDATPAQLKAHLLAGAEPTSVPEAPRLLNAARVVARAVDEALPDESATHLLSIQSATFTESCDPYEAGGSMGNRMDVECALIEVDSAGTVTGGGQLIRGDAQSAHTFEGLLDLSALSGTGSTFTLRGTDWMPGPGALPDDEQDHAWTVFEDVRIEQVGEAAKGTAVWLLSGRFRGSAELFEDSSGETQADCEWSGTFTGTLIETAPTGWTP